MKGTRGARVEANVVVAGGGLSAAVRARRLALRLTQRQAAERAEVSLATWQSVERAGSEVTAFQELTLARVAHGLDSDLTTLIREATAGGDPHAGRLAVLTGADGQAGATDGGAAGTPAEALVADVSDALLRLAAVSEETFHLVAGQALEAADRFLKVLED